MPSVAVSPLQLRYAGGAVSTIPARQTIAPLALRFAGGEVNAGPASNLSVAAAVPKLDRLTRFEQVQRGEEIHPRFQKIWQDNAAATEAAFAALGERVTDIATIVARLEASERLAQAAKTTADAASERESIANSFTDPAGVLQAGSDGTVSIAAHVREYGDGTRVDVDAGSVSGFAAGAYVSVYYVDAGRTGGAVAYQGTTNPIAQKGDTHVVGQVTIPQTGEPPASGGGGAPGYTPPPQGGGDGLGNYD